MTRQGIVNEVMRRTGRTALHVNELVDTVLDGDPFVYERALSVDPAVVGLILGLATGRLQPDPDQGASHAGSADAPQPEQA